MCTSTVAADMPAVAFALPYAKYGAYNILLAPCSNFVSISHTIYEI